MSGEAIGMMEGAFFVSKGVILEWLNERDQLNAPIQSTIILVTNSSSLR